MTNEVKRYNHKGHVEAIQWDGTDETHKKIVKLLGDAMVNHSYYSEHDGSFLIRCNPEHVGLTRVYPNDWVAKWYDGTFVVDTHGHFLKWYEEDVVSKQSPREDGWYYRGDAAFPFQAWCPFDDPKALVEVKNTTIGTVRVDTVANIWWGYATGLESENVVNYARLSIEKPKITPADALRRQVRLRKDIREAFDYINEKDSDVTIEVFHNGTGVRKIIVVPPEFREDTQSLLGGISCLSREEFIKEYVDV